MSPCSRDRYKVKSTFMSPGVGHLSFELRPSLVSLVKKKSSNKVKSKTI
ncbi:hypothetical protein SLEP1_g39739 [Rubroshorea leprosula]|uniref:Uncharacterized protein n=1 Tax=Rubroshorea leprosula TaxID=152421 RepID=A0AAV5L2D5_9ROSI|nr:hypothetical protein SLEP1_g39739 [Rubroshorea leprosula]